MDGNAQTIIVEGQYQRINIQGYPFRFSSNVSDLGELLDDQLKMLGHSLTVDAKKTLVNAFVASCLDFCNSLYHGIGDQGSTGQIWASSDCGGQTRKLGNTTIYLWFFMFCVAYSNGAIGPCPFLRPKKSVFDKRKNRKKWLALFVYLFKQFFQAFKC